MREEEKEAVEHLNSFLNITEYVWIKEKERLMVNIKIALNLIENQQKELNSLKEIEQLHREVNGKLRVELEQYKLLEANIDKANKIIAENKFDEGLYGLLIQEKEKNKSLKKQIKEMQEYYKNADFIFKDKIKEKMEQTKKVYDEEMKPYMIEVGNGEKVLNVTYLSKKEKEELINKRNCLLVQIKTYEMLLEEK